MRRQEARLLFARIVQRFRLSPTAGHTAVMTTRTGTTKSATHIYVDLQPLTAAAAAQ
jgi:hypothetical protein